MVQTVPAASLSAPCRAFGRLISKGSCYALRDGEGHDMWLEMERIPLHLIDLDVRVDGRLFAADLLSVESIGPA